MEREILNEIDLSLEVIVRVAEENVTKDPKLQYRQGSLIQREWRNQS